MQHSLSARYLNGCYLPTSFAIVIRSAYLKQASTLKLLMVSWGTESAVLQHTAITLHVAGKLMSDVIKALLIMPTVNCHLRFLETLKNYRHCFVCLQKKPA